MFVSVRDQCCMELLVLMVNYVSKSTNVCTFFCCHKISVLLYVMVKFMSMFILTTAKLMYTIYNGKLYEDVWM